MMKSRFSTIKIQQSTTTISCSQIDYQHILLTLETIIKWIVCQLKCWFNMFSFFMTSINGKAFSLFCFSVIIVFIRHNHTLTQWFFVPFREMLSFFSLSLSFNWLILTAKICWWLKMGILMNVKWHSIMILLFIRATILKISHNIKSTFLASLTNIEMIMRCLFVWLLLKFQTKIFSLNKIWCL